MEKIELYKANDGKIFHNEIDCAKYEMETDKTIVEKIEASVSNTPGSHQVVWCNSNGCACMGCVNHKFIPLGLERAHWAVWMEMYRKPRLDDGRLPHDKAYGLFLNIEEEKNVKLIKSLKEITLFKNKTVMAMNDLLIKVRSGKPIYKDSFYLSIKELQNQIENKTKIICEIKIISA